MIFKIFHKEDNNITYEFTGRHIYNLIHYLSLKSKDLELINKLIIDYKNDTIKEKYIEMLLEHKNIHLILSSIDAMYNGQKVYVEEDKLTKQSNWFEYLFVNQNGNQINPPIVVSDPYETKIEIKELCGHL